MRISIFSFLLLCALFTSNAQTTTYYNAKNKKVKSLEKADYYVVLVEDSAKEYRNLERRYNKAGQILSEQRFFWKDNNGKQLDGVSRKWYDNGQLKSESNYKEGRRTGSQILYKEDGSLMRTLDYLDGKIFSVANKNVEILQTVEHMPEFPGGDKELAKFISANLKYPSNAVENRIQGVVLIRFAVLVTGEVAGAEVLRSSNNDELDNEAIRVVELLPNFIPGNNNGNVSAVYYVLPIWFHLKL